MLKALKVRSSIFFHLTRLAWQTAIKYTGIKLELLRDYDMLLMFEKGIQGGITQAVHLYGTANNKCIEQLHSQMQESSFLQNLDADNDYMVPKYDEKLRLCYMDTDSFAYHIKTYDLYFNDISRGVERLSDTGG